MIEPKLVVRCTIPSDFDLSGPYIYFMQVRSLKSNSRDLKENRLEENLVLLYFLEAGGILETSYFFGGFFFFFFWAFPLILNGMENLYSVYPIHCNFLLGVYKRLHNQFWNMCKNNVCTCVFDCVCINLTVIEGEGKLKP